MPAPPQTFTGRATELALLEQVHDTSTLVISAIDGMAGIGKTALAVQFAHRIAGRYPDGQLFIDLHGFTHGVGPIEPAEALDRMLRALGVPGLHIPGSLDERAALYRTRLADQRMLILLDNAATEAHVQPLLPGAAGCLVLVTSRRRLTALEATSVLSLDTLPVVDAVQLFVCTADRPELSAPTPEQAAKLVEVVELCGRLPLAIRIAAARLKHRRGWAIADLVRRLRGQDERLALLDDGQRSVHATLHLSYQYLSAESQRMFRLLGLHPGADVDPYAAAALTGASLDKARRLLDGLVDDHLLQEPTAGRYRFHDLVRAHAADTAASEETPAQQQAALDRLLDYYRHTTATATDATYPFHRQHHPTVPPTSTPTPTLADRDQAELWLDTDLANLLAATQHAARHHRSEHTWQLSAMLDRHLRTRGRYLDAATLHQHALHVAQHLGDHAAAMNALNGLGSVHRVLGRYDQASDHFRRALHLAQDIGDRSSEQYTLTSLGHVHRMQGLPEQTADHYRQALHIAQGVGDRSGELYALTGLGHVHCMQGRPEAAADHYRHALRIAQSIGDRNGELRALSGLGHLHQKHERYEQATDCYQRVFDLAHNLGNRNWQFEALQGLGRIHHATGHPDLALTHHQQALQQATDLAQPADQARAHDGLARDYHALNNHNQARRHWQHALDILTSLNTTHTEDSHTNVPNIRLHLANLDKPQAATAPD